MAVRIPNARRGGLELEATIPDPGRLQRLCAIEDADPKPAMRCSSGMGRGEITKDAGGVANVGRIAEQAHRGLKCAKSEDMAGLGEYRSGAPMIIKFSCAREHWAHPKTSTG